MVKLKQGFNVNIGLKHRICGSITCTILSHTVHKISGKLSGTRRKYLLYGSVYVLHSGLFIQIFIEVFWRKLIISVDLSSMKKKTLGSATY